METESLCLYLLLTGPFRKLGTNSLIPLLVLFLLFMVGIFWDSKAPYTLSVKLSDFNVWRHTWQKNWVNCAVLRAIAQASELSFPVVFHTEKCAVHSDNPTVSSVNLLTPRWHHLKAHPFLAIHSADEHRMIRGLFFFQPPMGYKKKTNWHNIIILLPKVQQGLTYFST